MERVEHFDAVSRSVLSEKLNPLGVWRVLLTSVCQDRTETGTVLILKGECGIQTRSLELDGA